MHEDYNAGHMIEAGVAYLMQQAKESCWMFVLNGRIILMYCLVREKEIG
jgi:hypothetical protein